MVSKVEEAQTIVYQDEESLNKILQTESNDGRTKIIYLKKEEVKPSTAGKVCNYVKSKLSLWGFGGAAGAYMGRWLIEDAAVGFLIRKGSDVVYNTAYALTYAKSMAAAEGLASLLPWTAKAAAVTETVAEASVFSSIYSWAAGTATMTAEGAAMVAAEISGDVAVAWITPYIQTYGALVAGGVGGVLVVTAVPLALKGGKLAVVGSCKLGYKAIETTCKVFAFTGNWVWDRIKSDFTDEEEDIGEDLEREVSLQTKDQLDEETESQSQESVEIKEQLVKDKDLEETQASIQTVKVKVSKSEAGVLDQQILNQAIQGVSTVEEDLEKPSNLQETQLIAFDKVGDSESPILVEQK